MQIAFLSCGEELLFTIFRKNYHWQCFTVVAFQISIRALLPTKKRSKKCFKLLNFVDYADLSILFFAYWCENVKTKQNVIFLNEQWHFRFNPRFLLSFAWALQKHRTIIQTHTDKIWCVSYCYTFNFKVNHCLFFVTFENLTKEETNNFCKGGNKSENYEAKVPKFNYFHNAWFIYNVMRNAEKFLCINIVINRLLKLTL